MAVAVNCLTNPAGYFCARVFGALQDAIGSRSGNLSGKRRILRFGACLVHYTVSAFIDFSKGINHRSIFYKQHLINHVFYIFDPFPSLQASGARV